MDRPVSLSRRLLFVPLLVVLGVLAFSAWSMSSSLGRFGTQVDDGAEELRSRLTAAVASGTPMPEKDRIQVQREVFQAEFTARAAQLQSHVAAIQVLVQAVGGSALLLGLWFTWENLQVTRAALGTTRRGQYTDRFTRAVEQLASDNEAMRLAAIYTLDELSHLDANLYWPAIQMLTSFLRRPHATPSNERNASLVPPRHPPVAAPPGIAKVDVQAVINALRYRERAYETRAEQVIDLSGANLSSTDLSGIHFENAQLENARFDEAVLLGAYLQGANLRGALFRRATVTDANFRNADTLGADFTEAIGVDRARGLTLPSPRA